MCGQDRSGTPVRTVCPKKHENRLDCGHDDYFSTNPQAEELPGRELERRAERVPAAQRRRRRHTGRARTPRRPGRRPPSPPDADGPGARAERPQRRRIRAGRRRWRRRRRRRRRTAARKPPAGRPADHRAGRTAGRRGPPAARPPAVEPAAARGAGGARGPRPDQHLGPADLERGGARPRRYEVVVDGTRRSRRPSATRARLIGLRPDTTYRVTVRSPARLHWPRPSAADRAGRPAGGEHLVRADQLADRRRGRPVRGPHRRTARRSTLGGPTVTRSSSGSWSRPAAARTRCSRGRPASAWCRWTATRWRARRWCRATARRPTAARWSLQASDLRLHAAHHGRRPGRRRRRQRFGAHRLLVLQNAGNGPAPELDGGARLTGRQGEGERRHGWTRTY